MGSGGENVQSISRHFSKSRRLPHIDSANSLQQQKIDGRVSKLVLENAPDAAAGLGTVSFTASAE